jgi:hypothetical protein
MENFNKNIKEALDLGGKPNYINQGVKHDIESGEEEILGTLPDHAQEYLELIVSSEYRNLIDRLVHYTGIQENRINLPSVAGQAYAALQRVISIERRNPEFYEELAKEVVLQLPEFKFIKKSVDAGLLELDVKLGRAELGNAITEEQPQDDVMQDAANALEQAEEQAEEQEPEEDGLTQAENADFNFAMNIMDDTDKKLRRRLANSLTQGNAINKLYLFNLVADRLNEVDPNLVQNYGLISTINQLAYYFAPKGTEEQMIEDESDMIGGSEEVTKDAGEDKVIIKVRGVIFPNLVHELVKGIYEYLSLRPETKEISKTHDTVGKERMDMIVGAPLWKKLTAMIPDEYEEYIPRIYQSLIALDDIDDIKAVFNNTPEGHEVINNIIQDIENERREHEGEDEDDVYRDQE